MNTMQEKEGNELFLRSTHHRRIVSGVENNAFPSLSLNFICKTRIPAVQGWGLVCIGGDSLGTLGNMGRQEASSP